MHDYIDRCQRAFERAAGHHLDEHVRTLAGRVVRFRFSGPLLSQRLAPAFEHLDSAAAKAPASLTIHAWDRNATGVAAPAPPWSLDAYGPRERIRGLDESKLRASYDAGHGLLSLAQPGRGRAVFHALDAERIPRWVQRMPFRHLLGWWAGDEGLTFVHTAAVGHDGRCVLVPGASGSGKSTTALAASEHGLDFLADDLCLVDVAERRAYAPFAWAKAEADAVRRIPSLAGRIASTQEGQSLLAPANLGREAKIVGIAIPRLGGQTKTSWRPATAPEAVFALAPSTILEGNGAGTTSLPLLAELARAVPAFKLELGTDMQGVAGALDELISAAGR